MKNYVNFFYGFTLLFTMSSMSFGQCDMEIMSFDPVSMDISIVVHSGVNCGSPTDSIGEFLLGITTEPAINASDSPPCFYSNGWGLLIFPVNFVLVDINAPGPWLMSGDTIHFNIIDAFILGADASLCWQEAINNGFFEDYCWKLAITQSNDRHSWPYEDNGGLGGFDYPDTNTDDNMVQFSPFDPYCNPEYNDEPNPCEDASLFIPNTFTPNGDGKNEAFKPIIVAPAECWDFWEFKIYNRWGTVVFESNYPGQQWLGDSGREPRQHYVPDAVYVWHLRARHRYGAWYDKHGHVTIFR